MDTGASAGLEHKHTDIVCGAKPVARLFMNTSQSGASVLSHQKGTDTKEKQYCSTNTVAINQKQDAGFASLLKCFSMEHVPNQMQCQNNK